MEFLNNINQITIPELIALYEKEFKANPRYRLMLDGDRYYRVDNTEISSRKMVIYDDNHNPVDDPTKPNNKLKHGFMHTLVDDKINYLLSKPLTMECEDETYLGKVQDTLGKQFQRRLTKLGYDASNKGITWLHPYVASDGNFKTLLVPGEQGIPLWSDNDHEELDAFIYIYDVAVIEGKEQRTITKAEYWTPDGVAYYVKDKESGVYIIDAEMYLEDDLMDDDFQQHFKRGNEWGSWGKVPFVAFKNNDVELPDLQFVKSLIDGYDVSRSDSANFLQEIQQVIYALRGYDGTNLAEFMADLRYYRAIKVDEDGGVDVLNSQMDMSPAKEHYDTLRKDIYDFGGGVDKNSDKLGNSPSGIALKFIYSGLDLKCNSLEQQFAFAFEQLLYFVNQYLGLTGAAADQKEISLVFNRDIAINESQAITDCQNSQGIISNRTIIANHPYVTDLDDELKQIEKEQKNTQEEDYPEDFKSSRGGEELDGEE